MGPLEDKPYTNPDGNVLHDLLSSHHVHESMNSTFSNTALLKANEKGMLMRIRRDSEDFHTFGPFVRTRQVASLGFDLTMTEEELAQERTELLDWVARNAPKTRKLSLIHI